jgi:NitT/TauT family transport system ATP-binding protein
VTQQPDLLRMDGVGKVFAGGVTALKDMNLRVSAGEFVSLLGPSGCGKSTALRLIAGLMQPTTGKVRWQGAHEAGDLGVVFQEPTLMPWATVEKNVWLPLRLKGESLTDARPRIAQALAMVGLDRFANAYPRELSGGMKMRVSIARALVTQPRLILMDEPFAALDEITRNRMNDDLLALRARLGCTVIFVTHSVFESVYLSDRIVVMAPRPGRVADELTVTAPRRDAEFRTSVEYAGLCRAVSASLSHATGDA